MDISDKDALRNALGDISKVLDYQVPSEALERYLRGLDPDMTGYEKLVGRGSTLPAIAKYVLVAESYLAQPELGSFYDIFRAARIIPLVRALHRALTTLHAARVRGFLERAARLVATIDLDDFESVLFELLVAARYGEVLGFDCVEFLDECSDRRTPDLLVRIGDRRVYVECKRIDRMTDASVAFRDDIRGLARPVLGVLRERGIQAAIATSFMKKPSEITQGDFEVGVFRAVSEPGRLVESKGFAVLATLLHPAPLSDYPLIPSPAFFWDRYKYRSGDWHGIVHSIIARKIGPSFLDVIDWESALMWRLDDKDLVWAAQRLPFTRFFDGLEQLAQSGEDTVLHVWFERSPEYGHRQENLFKLSDTLAAKSKVFAWIIMNETFADVSIGGRFDFQEHASGLGGLARATEEPPVASVFVDLHDVRGTGEWGVGLDLPSIDDEH